jgi:uncharacterized protein (TIGR00661 family)
MADCVFIVQGEGRGHMSQSIALKEYLDKAGHVVKTVFVGTPHSASLPDYLRDHFPNAIRTFQSPYFLGTPNKKGIYVGRTLLFNLLRSFIYLREVQRIRREIDLLEPEVVFNFYDVVGALALKKVKKTIQRIGIGHHFLLHLKDYFGETSPRWHRFLLSVHTRIILSSCDRILALSFSEQPKSPAMEAVPPLIRRDFREMTYHRGDRYLVYLLKEGYIYDLISLARKDPLFLADVFTNEIPEIDLPAGIRIHSLSGALFRKLMAHCKGLITTAGFDVAAEAAYHGIPLAVIPAGNHFEQKCNGIDIEQHGIGLHVDRIEPAMTGRMRPSDPAMFRKWVEKSEALVLNCLKE